MKPSANELMPVLSVMADSQAMLKIGDEGFPNIVYHPASPGLPVPRDAMLQITWRNGSESWFKVNSGEPIRMVCKMVVHTVELPVEFSDRFVTPDFQQLFDFYPEYERKAKLAGKKPFRFSAYLMYICEKLEKLQLREGRTAEVWLSRCFQHFGPEYVHDLDIKYSGPLPL